MHERSEVRERKDRKTCREAVSGVQSQSKEKLDRGWENGPVRCKSQPGWGWAEKERRKSRDSDFSSVGGARASAFFRAPG